MNVVISLDHNFVMPCGVMLQSLCSNNKDVAVHCFALTDDSFTLNDKKVLEDILTAENTENSLSVIFVSDEQTKAVQSIDSWRYPKQVCYRLFMSSLLPVDVDKVIYLDGDLIVRKSLKDLWNTDMENYSVGVVPDSLSGTLSYYNRLHYPITLGYFNSGMMLINLSYWRKHQLEDKFVKFIKESKSRIYLPDQDVLNYVTRESKKHVAIKYNVQTQFLYKMEFQCFSVYQYHEEFEEARRDPVIIHFSGCRPWEKGCNHPFKEEFFKYRSHTIWNDMPLKKVHKGLKFHTKEFIRWALTPFGITHYVSDYFDRSLKLVP